MKRPMLISGITITIVCAFLMLFSKTAAIVTIVLAVSAFVLYLIKPLKLRKYIIIPFVCVFAVLATLSFFAYTHLKFEPYLKYDSQTLYISGNVVTTPVTKNGKTTFTLKTKTISNRNESVKINVTVPEDTSEDIELYDFISLEKAELCITKNENNHPELTSLSDGILLNAYSDEVNFLWHSERTIHYHCLNFRETISKKINSFMHNNTGELLKGMLFGDSNNIEAGTLKAFRSSGIAHLLAVSGLHTSLWCGLLMIFLNLFRIPEPAQKIICIIFLVLFCTVSGFTPSVLRASVMMFSVLITPFFKRQSDSLNSLGFAVTALLLSNPYMVVNASFQLSVAATLGVVLASSYEPVIREKLSAIKFKPIRSLFEYILCSLLLSCVASIFILPISAYCFNVFSLITPISNIFCVKLAFYGLISGTVATSLTFINNTVIRSIAIFIFDITEYLLNILVSISKWLSSFKYCTIPVHSDWLIYGVLCVTLILFVGYIIYKIKDNINAVKITAVIAVVALFINISIPLLPTKHSNKLTVFSSGNNLHVIIRSGTHYMYISNSNENVSYDIYDYLPKATCESLDYYLVTHLSYNALSDLQKIKRSCSPLQTHVTPSVKYLAHKNNVELPENTIISVNGEYTLNSKISIEIIDTYPMKYAIIKGNERTVYIHLDGDTDFSKVTDAKQGDTFIYTGIVPKKTPQNADTVIISAGSNIITDEHLKVLKNSCSNVFVTSRDGDIEVYI